MDLTGSGQHTHLVLCFNAMAGKYYYVQNDMVNNLLRIRSFDGSVDNGLKAWTDHVVANGKIWAYAENLAPLGSGVRIHLTIDRNDGLGWTYIGYGDDPGVVYTQIPSGSYIGIRAPTTTASLQIDNFGGGAVAASVTITPPAANFNAQSVAPTLIGGGGGGGGGSVPVFKSYMTGGPATGTTLTLAPCAVGDSVAVGDLLVITTFVPNTALNVSTVTDNKGNTWNFIRRDVNTTGSLFTTMEMWYCAVTVAMVNTDLITVTFPGSSANKAGVCMHFTNVAPSPYDVSANSFVSSPTTTLSEPTTPTTTQAAELVLSTFQTYQSAGGPTYTPGSGYTAIGTFGWSTGNGLQFFMEYKTVTTTGTQTGTATASAAPQQYHAIIATFKGATAVSLTINAPPVNTNMSAVAPVPRVDEQVAVLPGTFNSWTVAPAVTVSVAVVAPPASFSASSVAPLARSDATAIATPAGFSASAPTVSLALALAPAAAVFNASIVAPITGNVVVSPASNFTVSAVGPLVTVSVVVAPYAAFLTASSVGPVPALLLVSPVALFTSSVVAPTLFKGVFINPTAIQATFTSVNPLLSTVVLLTPMVFSASSIAPSISRILTLNPMVLTASTVVPIIEDRVIPPAAGAVFSTVLPTQALVMTPAAMPITLQSIVSIGNTVAAVPAVFNATMLVTGNSLSIGSVAARFTASSVSPSFAAGSGLTLNVPVMQFSATVLVPATNVYVVVPVGLFTAASVGPGILAGAGLSITAPPANFTATSAGASLSRLIAVPFGTATFSSAAPSFVTGSGITLATPAAKFTASAIATIAFSSSVTAVPAMLTTSGVGPIFNRTFLPSAGNLSASMLAPFLTVSVTVVETAMRVTMSAVSAVLSTVLYPTPSTFTAGASSPNPILTQTVVYGSFSAKATAPILDHTMTPTAPVATFSVVGGQIKLAIPFPPATWSGDVVDPSLAFSIPVLAGRTTFSAAAALSILKLVSAVPAAWVGTVTEPNFDLRWSSPAGVFTANQTTAQINRGQTAVPILSNYSAALPTFQRTSAPSVYKYMPGDIIDSSAWPDHVGA